MKNIQYAISYVRKKAYLLKKNPRNDKPENDEVVPYKGQREWSGKDTTRSGSPLSIAFCSFDFWNHDVHIQKVRLNQ